MIPFPKMKYAVVYADPPWDIRAPRWTPEKGHVDCQPLDYPVMTDGEIISLPVDDIIQEDALLFIWCVDSRIPILPAVLEAWGFRWGGTAFIWHKTGQRSLCGENAPFGPLPRRGCEVCFLGKRGRWIGQNVDVRQFLNAPRREHSRKPDEVRLRIEKLVGPVPKIELFARRRYPGWDAWGDEVPPKNRGPFATEGASP